MKIDAIGYNSCMRIIHWFTKFPGCGSWRPKYLYMNFPKNSKNKNSLFITKYFWHPWPLNLCMMRIQGKMSLRTNVVFSLYVYPQSKLLRYLKKKKYLNVPFWSYSHFLVFITIPDAGSSPYKPESICKNPNSILEWGLWNGIFWSEASEGPKIEKVLLNLEKFSEITFLRNLYWLKPYSL